MTGTTSWQIRVLIADDEALMRSGLRLLVDGTHGIAVVGECSDGDEALARADALDPDVILMDVRMPRLDGIEATRRLVSGGSRARVIVLTAFDTDGFLLEALRAGAVSFLLKDSPPDAVVGAILDAAAGRPRFSPQALQRLVRIAAAGGEGEASGMRRSANSTSAADSHGHGHGHAHDDGERPGPYGSPGSASATSSPAIPTSAPAPSSSERTAPSPTSASLPAGITEREWEVGRLVAQGCTNTEIAEALFLSLATVKTHLSHLFHKLHVTNRVQLAIRVLEHER